jgi:hypothetical protein
MRVAWISGRASYSESVATKPTDNSGAAAFWCVAGRTHLLAKYLPNMCKILHHLQFIKVGNRA